MSTPQQPLLRDLIRIPDSVGDADFVVRAAEAADLASYVVTDELRANFADALKLVGHAVTTGRSQAKFLHGSFGSGKSHFMAVLREILKHNPAARDKRGLSEPVTEADSWLPGRNLLTLTFHMLDARSVEQAVLEGYLHQITVLHPDAPPPAVHQSDALLADAARLREAMGDEKFFEVLAGSGAIPTGSGDGLAAMMTRAEGWTAQTYAEAAAAPPGTRERDGLVSALTGTFFSGAVRSGEYLDLDTGLQVITRHAKALGYDAMVLFMDEFILWLSTKIADHTFVTTEGAKLNKLVESSDVARPLPIASFVSRQRNLEEFLGPQVGGTERAALADVMRSVQGRLGSDIVLADTNLPEITEKRLLDPFVDGGRAVIDAAFAAVREKREVWDILLLGSQYGDAGIGSDATAFRRLYPFSPALVATLVALSQTLQRERTALRVMTELLVARRETMRVNDLIGVAALFDPLVLHGELPDRPELKVKFQAARDTYRQKLRPLLLARNGIVEEQAAGHEQFRLDDMLIRTLLLGALVPEVPALHNLNAARLHALNFGSITSPVPGYENQIVVDRLSRLANDAGELHKTEGPDPVFSLKLASVDYDRLLDLVPENETVLGVVQQLIRDLVSADMGVSSGDGTFGDLPHLRDWRGRRHQVTIRFGNIRDRDTMPNAVLYAGGEGWRVVVDYPFDVPGRSRRDDLARIEELDRGSHTIFWLPYFFTDEVMGRIRQLAKINYLLGGGGVGDRLTTLAADWSVADRQQGKIYLQQRQQHLRSSLLDSLKQAYGISRGSQVSDVEADAVPVLHTLAEGVQLGDPRGGTLKDAFDSLTADLLRWSFPGTPALPEDERPLQRSELTKVFRYALAAAADPSRGTTVNDSADQRVLRRICNPLRLGELSENRYAVTMTTCWWSQHLRQEAAKQGYTEHFPVHVLRSLLDQPAPRGFDRELQNLILAVFALEQQLAWYQHGAKVEVAAPQAVSDQMELRHPPMPDEDVWHRAVKRGRSMFGKPLPEFRTPATVSEYASTVRAEARAYAPAAEVLVKELTDHGAVLGLDQDARAGRLATARRVAKLLRDLAAESDDVVVVGLVADAEVGDVDDVVAGASFKQAGAVTEALARTQWTLLQAVDGRATRDEPARVIMDELRAAAAYDQLSSDLVVALDRAVKKAAALLAETRVPAPPPGAGGAKPRIRSREVANREALDGVVDEIGKDLGAGRRVRVTWEVMP